MSRPGEFSKESLERKALLWRQEKIARARMKRRILIWCSKEEYTIKWIAKKLGTSIPNIERTMRAAGMYKTRVPPRPRINGNQWNWLKKNFDKYDDKYLAKRLGYSASSMTNFRKRFDLLKGHKNKWSRSKHPRGATGMTHSPEERTRISARAKAMWADPNCRLNSDGYKQELSDRMTKLAATKTPVNNYSNAKRGYRADLGKIWFRSAWEANYARYLNLLISRGELHKWEFEPDTFWFEKIKRGVRSYTPDFKIWKTEQAEPYYTEVKGWMDPKSHTKLRRMAKYHPKIRIELVDSRAYYAIEKALGKIIGNWE